MEASRGATQRARGQPQMGLAEAIFSLFSQLRATSILDKVLVYVPPSRCALPHVARLARPPNPTTNPPYNSCPTALRASLAQGPAQAAESATTRVALAPPTAVRASPSSVAVATLTAADDSAMPGLGADE